MAPITPDLRNTQEDIKNVIQDLFQILVQVSNYDSGGRSSREPLAQDILALSQSLYQVHQSATLLPPQSNKGIPEPLIQYVENGRNPDIYTREFVELVRRLNQLARGKMHAFRDFRDTLAAELTRQMPEMSDDVRRVCEATGGVTEQHQAQDVLNGDRDHQGQGQGEDQERGQQDRAGMAI